jgi:hypothetical protein
VVVTWVIEAEGKASESSIAVAVEPPEVAVAPKHAVMAEVAGDRPSGEPALPRATPDPTDVLRRWRCRRVRRRDICFQTRLRLCPPRFRRRFSRRAPMG